VDARDWASPAHPLSADSLKNNVPVTRHRYLPVISF
jgi:hypothetical protein